MGKVQNANILPTVIQTVLGRLMQEIVTKTVSASHMQAIVILQTVLGRLMQETVIRTVSASHMQAIAILQIVLGRHMREIVIRTVSVSHMLAIVILKIVPNEIIPVQVRMKDKVLGNLKIMGLNHERINHVIRPNEIPPIAA
jgi:hypothetical protein